MLASLFLYREKLINISFREFNGEHAAVKHILPEYARKARSYYNIDIIDFENPWRMLAGRPAPEISAGHDHPRLLVLPVTGIETFKLQIFEHMGLQGLLGYLRKIPALVLSRLY